MENGKLKGILPPRRTVLLGACKGMEPQMRGARKHTDLLTPNGVRDDASRVGDEQIRLFEKVSEPWLFQGTKEQQNF